MVHAGVDQDTSGHEASYQQQIASLESELAALHQADSDREMWVLQSHNRLRKLNFCCSITQRYRKLGRMIQRVVTLVDNVSDLISEADHRHHPVDHSTCGETLTSSDE